MGIIKLTNDALTELVKKNTKLTEVYFQRPYKNWFISIKDETKEFCNFYLYDIRENLELKSSHWETEISIREEKAKSKPSTVRLDLFYMITVYAKSEGLSVDDLEADIEKENELLSTLIEIFYNLSYLSFEYFSSEFHPDDEFKIPMEVVNPKFLDEEGKFHIWSAIDQHLRPAIYLKVTVPVNLARFIEYGLVKSILLKFGISVPYDYRMVNINPGIKIPLNYKYTTVKKVKVLSEKKYLNRTKSGKWDKYTNTNTNGTDKDLVLISSINKTILSKVSKIEDNLEEFSYASVEVQKVDINETTDLTITLLPLEPDTNKLKIIGDDTDKIKEHDILYIEEYSSSNTLINTTYTLVTGVRKERLDLLEEKKYP